MVKAQREGKHKRYGHKMGQPRIGKSKEKRSCGPLGRYLRWKLWLTDPKRFKKPSVMPKRK